MNKFLRKAMILALAGTMTLGMSSTALAAENTTPASNLNTSASVSNDTTTINLIKDYIRGEGTASDSASPAENFVFTITPYGVWNAGSSTGAADGAAYNVDNMPALAEESQNVTLDSDTRTNVVTIKSANVDGTKGNTAVTLSNYNSVGDFWYEVKETNANTTGVFYGTNDSKTNAEASLNGGHDATYYIHVQVVNDTSQKGRGQFLRSVTMHKTAPLINGKKPTKNIEYNTWVAQNNYTNQNNVKVNDIQNTYYAGNLSIKKEVTGNAGDKDKRFKVTVTFTKPEGTIITSDIKYDAVNTETGTETTQNTIYGQKNSQNSWTLATSDKGDKSTATATVTFWIKHDETVTFKNIPYGVTYTVAETKPDDDTYTNKLVFTSADGATTFNDNSLDADKSKAGDNDATGDFFGADKAATGSISDASDLLTITNNKDTTIDVGVITSNAPYAAMLVLAGLAVLLYVRRRKNMIEE